jgi:hypothetical protein
VQLAFDDVEEVGEEEVVVGFENNLGSWQTEMIRSDGDYDYQS